MINVNSDAQEEPKISLSIDQKLAALHAEKLSKKALLDKYPHEFTNLTCVLMRAYACLCVLMRAYACLCVLMRELEDEYFISCGEYGVTSVPGSEYLVVFNKTSEKLSIIQGE